MKNLLKISAIGSLFLIACLLISACGGDTENFVQGNGQIDVFVTNSATGLALPDVQIEVRKVSATDPNVVSRGTTDALGKATFQETIGTDYYFTFIKTGYTTQNYSNNPVRPELTATKTINVAMVP
jgi:5-hydroxyisourate hydrolase-like protein (transthyretin family)